MADNINFDFVIKNCDILDGTGIEPFVSDIGILNDKIIRIGTISNKSSSKVIDGTGLFLSPGFIDIHGHSEFTLLVEPRAESKIRQGITTEVVGNCGSSAAPFEGSFFEKTQKYLKDYFNIDCTWKSLAGYRKIIQKTGIAINIINLAGHGEIRASVIGYEDRAPSFNEMQKMKELLCSQINEGAWGLSTGLIYTPSCFAETQEIIELCLVCSKLGGIYTSHIRGEAETLIDAVAEAIEISRSANIRLQLSHHKASGVATWGKTSITLKMIENAQNEGLEVFCDQYPYLAGATSLSIMLPRWSREGGGDIIRERLRDAVLYKKIKSELKSENKDWTRITISQTTKLAPKKIEGKNIAEISNQWGLDTVDTVLEILKIEDAAIITFTQNEEDLLRIMKKPYSVFCTDAESKAPYGLLSRGRPHPRAYGSFPRVISHYVKEKNIITLPEAIRKMTGLPAEILGVKKRGFIKEGYYADLVLFDYEKIKDIATYEDPARFPEGIKMVMVNGRIAVWDGEHTGSLAGRFLIK